MSTMNPFQAPSAELEGPVAGAGSSTGVGSTDVMVAELTGTGPWVRFFAVLGFVGSAMMALGALAMGGATLFLKQTEGATAALGGSVLYLGLAAMYFFVSYKLHAYGDAIRKVTAVRTVKMVELALARQRTMWKTLGIITIVGMALGLVAALGMAVVAGTGLFKTLP